MLRPVVWLIAIMVIGAAAVMPAAAHGWHFDTDRACDYRLPYDVAATPDGITFTRRDGTPSTVFMHDGHLRVDGHRLPVSASDAAGLRAYEHDTRVLLRDAAGVAREGVEIGYSALTTVAASFTVDTDQRQAMVERLNRLHARALRRIDATLGSGLWRQDDMNDLVEEAVGDAVPALVGSITSQAVDAALSGDQTAVARLKAEAQGLDTAIDREVDARSKRLEAQAKALCPRMDRLMALQQSWQLRVDGGKRLQLIQSQGTGRSRVAVAGRGAAARSP